MFDMRSKSVNNGFRSRYTVDFFACIDQGKRTKDKVKVIANGAVCNGRMYAMGINR